VEEQGTSIENLAQYLGAIEDPRCSGKVGHRLLDILVIAVCAVVACAESWWWTKWLGNSLSYPVSQPT
jgi:hypothetical protein